MGFFDKLKPRETETISRGSLRSPAGTVVAPTIGRHTPTRSLPHAGQCPALRAAFSRSPVGAAALGRPWTRRSADHWSAHTRAIPPPCRAMPGATGHVLPFPRRGGRPRPPADTSQRRPLVGSPRTWYKARYSGGASSSPTTQTEYPHKKPGPPRWAALKLSIKLVLSS